MHDRRGKQEREYQKEDKTQITYAMQDSGGFIWTVAMQGPTITDVHMYSGFCVRCVVLDLLLQKKFCEGFPFPPRSPAYIAAWHTEKRRADARYFESGRKVGHTAGGEVWHAFWWKYRPGRRPEDQRCTHGD